MSGRTGGAGAADGAGTGDAARELRPHERARREAPTDRVRLRRKADRGASDRGSIDAIVDAAYIGHIGWVLDGQPFVTPTAIWRVGDHVYWHGSAGSRMLQRTKGRAQVCVTATILDGFVLARSANDSSMNYRSVMILGAAEEVTDREEMLHSFQVWVDRWFPGRWAELRPATDAELRAITLLRVDLNEASAKVRAAGVMEDPADHDWPVWAGVVPLALVAGEPIADPHVPAGMATPRHLPAPGTRIQGEPGGESIG